MATGAQRLRLKTFKFARIWRRPKLNHSPQSKAIILRLRVCTPRKPNSARRPVIKGKLSTDKKVLAHIPGSGHSLRRFSKTLVCGVGARDVPIVNYSCMRSLYDFDPMVNITRRRSIYGLKNFNRTKIHVKRKYRNLYN